MKQPVIIEGWGGVGKGLVLVAIQQNKRGWCNGVIALHEENIAMYHCTISAITRTCTLYATMIQAQSTQLIASVTVSKLFSITIGNN